MIEQFYSTHSFGVDLGTIILHFEIWGFTVRHSLEPYSGHHIVGDV